MAALELILTGEPCDAARARELGLVLAVLPAERLLPHARDRRGRILSRGPLAVAQAKRLVHAGAALPLSAACELERRGFAASMATADAREGMLGLPGEAPAAVPGGVAGRGIQRMSRCAGVLLHDLRGR